MRPLKFRAWDKKRKFMDVVDGYDLFIADGRLYEVTEKGSWDRYIDKDNVTDNYEIMQYTGLKDKNGKEIYEGDVVSGKYPYGTTGVVTWIDKRGGLMIKMLDGLNGGAAYDNEGYKLNSFKCEVIGNIYQNPELIKS